MSGAVHYNVTYEDSNDLVWDVQWRNVWEMDKPFMVSFSVETNSRIDQVDFSELSVTRIASSSDRTFNSALLQIGDTFVAYRHLYASNRVWVRIVGEGEDHVNALHLKIASSLEPVKQREEKVRVKFWHWAGHGPDYNIRYLDAPTWEEIRTNYATSARTDLDRFVHAKPEDITGGRLAILHGPAGTGKTTMIRALCREWKSWCDIDYIIDPEQFFGNANYMTNTLMAQPDASDSPPDFDLEDDDDFAIAQIFRNRHPAGGGRHSDHHWRLLIIEDSEEFLNPNAKEHVGQALSRLLNVGDGFIGQGLNILILLTTNIPLSDVNEAVKRPGRCWVNVEVPKMSATEASEWLDRKTKESTLAELYEAKRESQIGKGVKEFERIGTYL